MNVFEVTPFVAGDVLPLAERHGALHVLEQIAEATHMGLTVRRDGAIIGLGAFFHVHGRWWASAWFEPEMRAAPVLAHRLARRALAVAAASGITEIYALIDDRIERSQDWARRLGFAPTEVLVGSPFEQVWKWPTPSQ